MIIVNGSVTYGVIILFIPIHNSLVECVLYWSKVIKIKLIYNPLINNVLACNKL